MQRTRWVDRKFTFDFPEGWLPNIIERLYGTTDRIRSLVNDLSPQLLTKKVDGSWSIKEHVGHLCDLESLHEGRIDDLVARKTMLRAADMTNVLTNQNNHNSNDLEILVANFNARRLQFISRLHMLDDATQLFRSMHPRLEVTMRAVDVAYFTAEHDDHHLATIRKLSRDLS